jgi:hypothetical protein
MSQVQFFSLHSIQWHFETLKPNEGFLNNLHVVRCGQGEPSTRVGSFLFLSEAS